MVNIFDFLRIRGDILFMDRNGDPLMLVEVQAQRPIDEWTRQQVVESLQGARGVIPYVMLADRKSIQVLGWDGEKLSEPLCRIPTDSILRHYGSGDDGKDIFDFYLAGLIGSWLRDMAYHWKSEHPPGYDQLEAIGLAERILDGTTLSEPAQVA